MKTLDFTQLSSALLDVLKNKGTDIVNRNLLSSTRAVGDAVQTFITTVALPEVLKEHSIDVNDAFSRRAMEDAAFFDGDGNYFAVDVKTHNKSTTFNMPNLISVRSLAKFYQNNDRNYFCLLIVEYDVVDGHIKYESCRFQPIEGLSWECLTLGALGWGQIQIANANKIIYLEAAKINRKQWMITMCEQLALFYDEEILKIGERKSWFAQIKQSWKNR